MSMSTTSRLQPFAQRARRPRQWPPRRPAPGREPHRRNAASPLRTISWSSTISTRMRLATPALPCSRFGVLRRGQCTSIAVPAPGLARELQPRADRRARSRMMLDPQMPRRNRRGRSPARRRRGAGYPALGSYQEIDARLARLGMLDHVVERLLGNPIERHLRRRAGGPLPLDASASRGGRACPLVASTSWRSRSPSGARSARRPQLLEQRAHLGQRPAGQLAQLGQAPLPSAGSRSHSRGITSAISCVENRVWVTASCSSRASRWRSSSVAACWACSYSGRSGWPGRPLRQRLQQARLPRA